MAARYWVGGAGSWSSTTKWSTTSGGASGASVPTSADDVIFDTLSGGKFIATIDVAAAVCNSLSITNTATVGQLTLSFAAACGSLTTGAFTTSGTAGNNRILFVAVGIGNSNTDTVQFFVNGAVSISDVDFQGIWVRGSSAPISGTRLGNRQFGTSGVTFGAGKTVYWNLAGAQTWSANGWAATSGGAPATTNYPLPQDTAVVDNTGAITTLTVDTTMSYMPTVNFTRTTSWTLSITGAQNVYGSWTQASGIVPSGTVTLSFCNDAAMYFTSAGKTTTWTINVYAGTLYLSDAYTSTGTFVVNNATFDTQGYAFTTASLTSNSNFPRAVYLRSSTVTITGSGTALNISAYPVGTGVGVFDAGTSTVNVTGSPSFLAINVTLNNLNVTPASAVAMTISLTSVNNLTLTAFNSTGNTTSFGLNATVVVTGTLTMSAPSVSARGAIKSGTAGTQRTLQCAAISAATHFDFQDIIFTGAASPVTFSNYVGDLGNNSGINFPAGRNVYLSTTGSAGLWTDNVWSLTAGGAASSTVYPLAQDTAVINDSTGATGINMPTPVTLGNVDFSGRTGAFAFTTSATGSPNIYGNVTFSSVITIAGATTFNFVKRGSQTLTSAGRTLTQAINVNGAFNGLVPGTGTFLTTATNLLLGDALTTSSTFTITLGNFNASNYNVTCTTFTSSNATAAIYMGSGTWTISGTGTVWTCSSARYLWCGTATILLSNNTVTARTMNLNGGMYYKITIGGTTSTSTTTLTTSTNSTARIGELGSTKTVAHTVTLTNGVITAYHFGRITLSGTVGNVVTFNGSGASASVVLYGQSTSGIDYLNISNIGISTASPGVMYAGANTTLGAGNTNVFNTAAPTPRTLYWVGGTGNWSDTAHWSTSSGGGSGAAIPTSFDSVTFDSASNATLYTATIDAGVAIARCAALSVSGPASGNVTLAGSVNLALHGSMTFAATGVTNSMSNTTYFAGDGSFTITSNGVRTNTFSVCGMFSTWTLGSAMSASDATSNGDVSFGTLNTNGYALYVFGFTASTYNLRAITFGSSTITVNDVFQLSDNSVNVAANLTLSAASSTLLLTAGGIIGKSFYGNNQTYGTVQKTSNTGLTFGQVNTFTSFSMTYTIAGFAFVFSNDSTFGTFSMSPATPLTRASMFGGTYGAPVTLTITSLTLTNTDLRDITLAGGAVPFNGTANYLGDCGGNTGITFPTAKTVYLNGTAGTVNSNANVWATTSGGAANANNYPLAQDTAIIDNATTATGLSIQAVPLGAIDGSSRTTAFALAIGTTCTFYNDLKFPSAFTYTGGASTVTMAKRTGTMVMQCLQTNAFSSSIIFNNLSATVSFTSAFTSVNSVTLTSGTFNTNGNTINVNSLAGGGTTTTINATNSTFVIPGASMSLAQGTTYTGPGSVMTFTSASAKTFTGNSVFFTGLTVDQGGAGALNFSGASFIAGVTNSYVATGATTITLASGSRTYLSNGWTASGAAGKILSLTAGGTCYLYYTGPSTSAAARVDYVTLSGLITVSPAKTSWYLGTNSTTTLQQYGFSFTSPNVTFAIYVVEAGTGTDTYSATVSASGNVYNVYIVEVGTGTQINSATFRPRATVAEAATGTETTSAKFTARSSVSETATGTDTDSATASYPSSVSDTATGTDSTTAKATFLGSVSELATVTDLVSAVRAFLATILETASSTDTASAAYATRPSVTESATGSDTTSTTAAFRSSVTNTATATDADAATQTITQSVVETATGTVTDVGYVAFPTTISETATGTDLDSAKQTAASLITETATGTATDAAGAAFPTRVTETATGTDTDSARNTVNPSVTENASGADAASTKYTANPVISEGATIADVLRAYATFATRISETASGIDVVTALRLVNVIISELGAASDTMRAVQLFSAAIQDGASVTDAAYTAGSVFNARLADSAGISDAVRAGAKLNATVLNSATITDAALAAFLWNLINDSQTANWQTNDDTQTPAWQTMSDSQVVSWQNNANSQTSDWQVIDDSQTPDWE